MTLKPVKVAQRYSVHFVTRRTRVRVPLMPWPHQQDVKTNNTSIKTRTRISNVHLTFSASTPDVPIRINFS